MSLASQLAPIAKLHYPLLNCLSFLWPSRRAGAFEAAATSALGPIVTLAESPSSQTVPNCVVTVHSSGSIAVWARGIESSLQGTLFMAGTLSSALGVVQDLNAAVAAYAFQLTRLLAPYAVGQGLQYYLVGHSFGAAAVEVLAGYLGPKNPTGRIELCSAGSPKPSPPGVFGYTSNVRSTRWMTEGDLVPTLPPHSSDWPIAAIAAGAALAASWDVQDHPDQGILLTSGGGVVRAYGGSPAAVVELPDATLALIHFALVGSSYHDLSYYVSALRNLVNFLSIIPQGLPDPIPPPIVHNSRLPPLRGGPSIYLPFSSSGTGANDVNTVIPPAWTPEIDPTGDGRYYVSLDTYIITIEPSLASARRTRHYLFKLIQRMARSNGVSPTGVSQGMLDLVGVMTSSTGGFSPIPALVPITNLP